MPGPVMRDPTPEWMKAENASVLDSTAKKYARKLAHLLGLDDPQSQVLGLMTTELPVGKLKDLIAERIAGAKPGITAYHGSPHDFERFDLSKIGTGEGAQAYGHGLYFAENEGVARAYREKLSGVNYMRDGKATSLADVATAAERQAQAHGAAHPDWAWMVANQVQDWVKQGHPAETFLQRYQIKGELRPAYEAAIDAWKRVEKVPNGKMYEVNIAADPATLLDWDKPLSEQSEQVRQALGRLWTQKGGTLEGRSLPPFAANSGATGESAHAAISTSYGGATANNAQAQTAASAAMKQAGIPGIKYLDQGSRAAGTGSRNYVIFDDSLITILKKYGVALPVIEGLRRQAEANGGAVDVSGVLPQ